MVFSPRLIFTSAFLFALSFSLRAAEPVKAAKGSLFQPSGFKSLGVLTVASGKAVAFDTGTETTPPSVAGAVAGEGALGVSQSGQVQVAVFAFDAIQLGEGAKVDVTGNRALVLLSKGAVVINTIIDLSGAPGVKGHGARVPGGPGGPGGEGGEYTKTFNSAPPPDNGGDGGQGMKDNGEPGHGFGGGFNERVKGGTPGGGAGHGGAGGETSEGSGGGGGAPRPMPGGPTYGDAALADLFGGSGGAGGSNDRNFQFGSGGGGGGAFALIAAQSINLGPKAQILARGGAGGLEKVCGGGGSGGSILVAATAFQASPGAVVDVSGGDGGDGGAVVIEDIKSGAGRRNTGSGGGGGGGRVAVYIIADFGSSGKNKEEKAPPAALKLTGGKGGTAAKDGGTGTCYDGSWPGLR